MSRSAALEHAARHYDDGSFLAGLARLVAVPSESQEARGQPYLAAYLTEHLRPLLEHMGFVCQVLVNPAPGGPLLLAERIEDPDLPTVLIYGHGDVIRGLEHGWQDGPLALAADRARRPASTAAGSPTTRASTRSTSPRSRSCSPSAAGSASTPRC